MYSKIAQDRIYPTYYHESYGFVGHLRVSLHQAYGIHNECRTGAIAPYGDTGVMVSGQKGMDPMRAIVQNQLNLVQPSIAHVKAIELHAMAKIMDRLLNAVALVQADLLHGDIDAKKGREGMSADLVLRVIVLKQMKGLSYEDLEFDLGDSIAFRSFCGLGIADAPPSKSTLQRNIKAVKAETIEAINRMLVIYARDEGMDDGSTVRGDCTVTKSAIHAPTDSSLLFDCVRVLVRLMGRAQKFVTVPFTRHIRGAKRKALAIASAASDDKRRPLYNKLLTLTRKTVKAAENIAEALAGATFDNERAQGNAKKLVKKLDHFITLTNQVLDQTHRRVILRESVPAEEKVVSIFEPHTDIIVKDRRETLYGHKLCLTVGVSGLVLDAVVEDGNPADSTLAVDMIKRQKEIYGRSPRQVAFDGGFTSKANLEAIKQLGVQDVAFSKGRGMSVTEMVKSSWVYRKLRRFRAGIEGIISFLKRSFCLRLCTWRSLASFKTFIWSSVIAANLLMIARHSLG
jgi:IS5 family transposase